MPRVATPGDGRLAIHEDFTVAATGVSDARLDRAVDRLVARISRQTGIWIVAPKAAEPARATLRIECSAAGPAYPTLGEDESYTLDVTGQSATIKAATIDGAMHGMATFVQLIAEGPGGFSACGHPRRRPPALRLARPHAGCGAPLDAPRSRRAQPGRHGRREAQCVSLAPLRRPLARLGPQPPNFERIVALNSGPLVTSGVEVPALYPHQVQLKREEGALLVDVRTDLQFDDVHIHGSVCIPSFSPGFGSKLAWLADHDQEIVFIGRDDADGRRAAKLALAVGVRQIAGLLAGGMTNWRQERHPADHTDRVAAADLRGWLANEPDLQLLDVREHGESDAGHLPGSVLTPWHDITGIPDGLDPTKPIAVICAGGARAATAASLLKRHGASDVIHVVDGGVGDLAAQGIELESSPFPPVQAPA